MTVHTTYPIVIIGAGPIGLAAAAHALRKGETPLIFGLCSTLCDQSRGKSDRIRQLLLSRIIPREERVS
ncbi:hypothetical protein [Dictyobacter formicarum]|uniref:FAD-binding domain-containing protein n=1 Tax=Dictyobacter formicarum TaxID=2778368 RepID=A0ABQ3VG57_9CHLR|nr:hypothetical protein [Dictyobacter formicarum]GHO84106.1 hypothetical protein KSZ_21120 [Dictyobacter formicarum]